jgi:hypothetical protein
MSILSATRRVAKFSTLAPRRRDRHEFAEGLLADKLPAPVNRLSGFFAGRAAAASAYPDGIPSSVTRIALIRGDECHEYRRAEDGLRWLRVSDGSPIRATSADRAYREGKVAILPDAPDKAPAPASPAPAPRPAPAPSPRPGRGGPSAEDVAFEMGRSAALEAGHGDVAPEGPLTAAERAAWHAGLAAGLAEAERSGAAALDALEVEQDWQARAEAGIYLPPAFVG